MPPRGPATEGSDEATLVLGPAVIAILLNVLLGGVTLLQATHYFCGKYGDKWPVILLVCWVTLVDIADTICAGNLMWYYTVDTYVNNALALLAPWQYHATAISSSMISVPVQHFLGWRMYQFSHSKILFGLVSGLSLGQGFLMIFVSASFIATPYPHEDAARLMPMFIVSYALALANELIITSNLLYHFYQHRTGMKNTDLVMTKLSSIVVETAVPVTTCSILAGVSVSLNARRNIRTQLMSESDSFNRFQFTQSAHFEFRRPGTPESQTSTIHHHHDRSGSDHSDATAVPSTPQSATFLIPHSNRYCIGLLIYPVVMYEAYSSGRSLTQLTVNPTLSRVNFSPMSRYTHVEQALLSLRTELHRVFREARAGGFPSIAKARSIINRGIAFSVLQKGPLHAPSDLPYTDEYYGVVNSSLNAYKLWSEVSIRLQLPTFGDDSPISLEMVFRWIDFVHPMYNRPPPVQNRTNHGSFIYQCISKLLISIIRSDEDRVLSAMRTQPRWLCLALDLWLNCSRYLRELTPQDPGETCITLTWNTDRICERFSEAGGEMSQILNTELLGLVDNQPRALLRKLATLTEYIASLEHIQNSAWLLVWNLHFHLAVTITRLPGFSGLLAPRALFPAIDAGARQCMEHRTSDLRVGMGYALDFLAILCTRADDNRNLIRAIEADLLELLSDVRDGDDRPGASYYALLNQIEACLVLPSVLRMFHDVYGELLQDEEDCYIDELSPDLGFAYRRHWEYYQKFRTERNWKRTLCCHNTTSAQHESLVRACPCGEAFYCSTRCQREHWKATHRRECRWKDGVWGLENRITLQDALFIIETVQGMLVAHHEDFLLERAQLPSRKVEVEGKTEGEENGRPKQLVFVIYLTEAPEEGDWDFAYAAEERDAPGDVREDIALVEVEFRLGAMSSEPISEEEMRLVAATFAEAGLTELSDLQIALVTLIQGTSAGAIMSISSIFAGLSSAKPEVFLSSLRPNPRAMVLLLDIWLHHPSYMGVARVGRVEVAGALFLAVKSALEGFIGGGHEDIRAMFFTELRVLVGRRRHFLASIADQTRFLVVIGAISSKWTWIWTMQLLVAHLVTQSPEFYGVLVPRSFFRSIIGCVQSLLNGCTTQDEGLRGVVEKAGELMFDLLARTQDTRNTRRAIEAGLFSFLRASDAVFEARVKSVEALKTYLADCAVLPSILRTLAKVNNELVQETPQSELNGRFGRLFYNARWQWKWYVRLKEDNPWIRNMPCENLLKEDHQQQKRISDGVWGLDDPSHPTEKGLTRVLHIDLRSAPEPGTDFTFSVDTQRMQNEPGGPGSKVYIGVILSVAGKYPHLMLPMGYDMKFFPVNRYVPSPASMEIH
ncbi:uncharacterized protein SCHCODRAFT_01172655 [Schizophyllum commune H4-8]|uniref:uncharacterized protein n=1 Tax=Schizophyllum commune (strain H4-8 / FGSC 9210) TaxID=578458 RepID=UPI002160C1A2|nr:uncharacterized protein SCHCODRAFT_01172655 [Schizophyllum commune H4-8]KAI5891835.1 hypothetical protein SCHCODRAFT_01172655 [Schizophyllum commune H4-8]